MPDQLETEIKFPVRDPAALRSALMRIGAISQGRVNEYNIRLDDLDWSLSEDNVVLRLRQSEEQNGEVIRTLTFKADLDPQDANSPVQTRREIEVNVSDTEAMLAILRELGYTPYWRYEKRREVFTWRRVEIMLDEMPYGWFVEIEGDEDDMRQLVEKLGLNMADGIPHSYAEIFQHVCRNLDLPVQDLTFEAFAGVDVPPEAYYPAG